MEEKQRFTRDDEVWINGFLSGVISGKIEVLEEIIKLLKAKRKQLTKEEKELLEEHTKEL